MSAEVPGPLEGLRVLDLMTGRTGAYASKLLADLGADVVKVEPLDGDPLRHEQPRMGDGSIAWQHYHANKRSIRIDLGDSTEVQLVRGLATKADVLLENHPVGVLGVVGLGYESLREANDRLVYTSVTPFGQTGPHASWKGGDIVVYATGGMMAQTGDPDRPPVRLGGRQALHLGSLYAAAATLTALTDCAVTGLGQHVDVSLQEAVAGSIADVGATFYQFNDGMNPQRVGTQHPVVTPLVAVPCKDGHFLLNCLEAHQYRTFVEWLRTSGVEVDEMLDDPELDKPISRLPFRDLYNVLAEQAAATWTKAELYEYLQSKRMPSAPVSTVADLATNAQLLARNYFVELEDDDGDVLTTTGAPYRFTETPWSLRTPAPDLDGDRAAILADAAGVGLVEHEPPVVPRRASDDGSRRALDGLRVVDFSWALAGPWAGRILATQGAEVIRVESTSRLDGLRLMASHPERAGAFINANAGKKGVTIDLTDERGVEIAHRLVAEADIVVENYRPGVMDRFGLGYDDLRALNPSLIMCSLPAQGSTGPHAQYVSYGPVLLSLSGITHMTGYPEAGPTAIMSGYVDHTAALHGVISILAALRHRDRTGIGQHIEISQFESAVCMLDGAMLDYFETGTVAGRIGNRDPNLAPHGCYPCTGDDEWVVLEISTDEEWSALVSAIGSDRLKDTERFGTVAKRHEHHDEIDEVISAWTAEREAAAAAAALQEAGVPAGKVQQIGDLIERDGHLADRGFYEEVSHPVQGDFVLDGPPFRLSRTPGGLRGRAGPLLGQHNEEVLTDILGMTVAEVAELRDSEVLNAHLVAPPSVDE